MGAWEKIRAIVRAKAQTRLMQSVKTFRQEWHIEVRIYAEILLLGLLIIELRNGTLLSRSFASRVPLLAAAANSTFHPERMQYVAASYLNANHQLRQSDLAFHPRLDT